LISEVGENKTDVKHYKTPCTDLKTIYVSYTDDGMEGLKEK
jgi:hypothetical protein